MDLRTGIGYDVHRLEEGHRLVLGGIEIPCSKGLVGHSDADVLIHAICDALLGAAAEGDLGQHFPDTNPKFRGISSLTLLEAVQERITGRGFRIMNLDAVIIAQEPRLAAHIDPMRSKLSETLSQDMSLINIKAKTNEGLWSL